MTVSVIVLRDETRAWVDKQGRPQRRRTVHCFPAPDDGAQREMNVVVPEDVPPLKPYSTVRFAITDWRGYDGEVTFFGLPVDAE